MLRAAMPHPALRPVRALRPVTARRPVAALLRPAPGWPAIAAIPALLLGGCYGVLWGEPALPDDDDSAPAVDDDDSAPVIDDDDTPPPAPTLVTLTCAPSNPQVDVAFGVPGVVDFAATGTWDDGSSGPAPAGAAWAIDGGVGGSVDATGRYTTPPDRGGIARVVVRSGEVEGTCTLDVRLHIDLGDGAAPGAVVDPACAPAPLYPPVGAVLPRNQAPPTLQWEAGAHSGWVVRVEQPFLSLVAFTDTPSWSPPDDVWAAMVSAGPTIHWSVAGGTWDGAAFVGPVCGGAAMAVEVSGDPLIGTVFYWCTGTQGVMRVEMGGTAPTAFLTPDQTGYCVGCHTVNPSRPDRVAMNYGGGNGWAVVTDVAAPDAPVLPAESRNGNFMALSPDGRRLVRSYFGALYLDDLVGGVELGALPTTAHATHPSWSADGTRLVYASCSGSDGADWVVTGCHLRTLEQLAPDQWGADQVLASPEPGWSFYYPTFSPDGAWVAFNRSTGDAYDDVDAALMLVPATGGVAIELAAANLGPSLYNSWPRWGPMHDDVAWLTFASRRRYGHMADGVAQIWLTALDLDAASTGADPSAPAVWLTGQDPGLGNHTPVWVPRFLEGR